MRTIQITALILALLLSSGCIAVSRKVDTSEELRLPVTFENAEAARLFYSRMKRPKPYMSDVSFIGLFPLALGVEWVVHETEWYNHLVRRTDINHDGMISEREVQTLLRHHAEEENDN